MGTLITIEGIDGAGKSTLAAALAGSLTARGRPARVVREPGGVDLSERVRTLVADPALQVAPRAEALLYAAARAQLVEELLRPALERDELLLLDRFSDSTLAYQGGGRGLGIEEMRRLDSFATGGLVPNLTLLLRISPEAGRMRLDSRAEGASAAVPDRLEREPEPFFAAVAAAYDQLAAAEPERIRVLDATREPEQVLAAALTAIEETGLG